MKPVICLMGPTASGKTPLAIELVQRLPLEIVSVDSTMVYRGLDIGSAKPTAEILKIAPHRLIDIRDPKEVYSAGQFVKDAVREIEDIHQKNKLPLLVGGTMLYYHVLQNGLAELPPADPAIRLNLQTRALQEGWTSLHEELTVIDPEAAARIKASDAQRIQRALEVFFQTGKTISQWQREETKPFKQFRFLNLALHVQDRSILHERIRLRFENMLQEGLIDEVKSLYTRGDLHADLPAIRSVGYRQVWAYLDGQMDYEAMKEKAIVATRQLAKRQMTWLRSWKDAHLLASDEDQLEEKVTKMIKAIV